MTLLLLLLLFQKSHMLKLGTVLVRPTQQKYRGVFGHERGSQNFFKGKSNCCYYYYYCNNISSNVRTVQYSRRRQTKQEQTLALSKEQEAIWTSSRARKTPVRIPGLDKFPFGTEYHHHRQHFGGRGRRVGDRSRQDEQKKFCKQTPRNQSSWPSDN